MLILPLRFLVLKTRSLVKLVKESISGALLCLLDSSFPVDVSERRVSLLGSLDTYRLIDYAPFISSAVLNGWVAVA